MDGGALMQVNLCPTSNNGKASCSVITQSDNVSESQTVVKLNQTISSVCPLEGQLALITKPSTTQEPTSQDELSTTSSALKRKLSEPKQLKDDCKKSRKNKLWLQDNMSKAIDAVQNGMHIRSASKLFSVPRTTLKYKLASSDHNKGKSEGVPTISASAETQSSDEVKTEAIASVVKQAEQSMSNSNDKVRSTNKIRDVTQRGILKLPEQSFKSAHISPAPTSSLQTEITGADAADRPDVDNVSQNNQPKKKCKLWSEETMNEAVEAVSKGSKIKDAAVFYGVPMSTLGNRVLVRRRRTADFSSKTMATSTKTQNDVVVDTSGYTSILPAPCKHQTTTSPVATTVTMATTSNKPKVNSGKLRGKIKQWSEESMEKALKALNEEGLSVYAAAKKYNVPKSTLDAKKKRREYNSKGTSETDIVINPEDEYPLVCYVNICARFGITNIKNVVLLLATEKAENRGRWDIKEQGLLPDAWWEGFLNRCARLIKNVDINRQPLRPTEARLGLFFDKLLAVINSSQYHKSPLTSLDQRTFTLQEFRFKATMSRGWLYDEFFPAGRGLFNNTADYSNDSCYSSGSSTIDDCNDSNSNYNNGSHTDKVSSMCCVNASGTSLPPLFVVHTSQSDCEVDQAGPEKVVIHNVNDQSRDSDYYYTWFNEVFIKHAHHLRPVILLLDPDTVFITPEFLALANKHQIILLCLPPLSARMTQPLYTAVLPALQQGLEDVSCSNCSEFPKCFKEVWRSSVNTDVIKSGFSKSGIYPLNRKVYDHLDLPVV